MGAVSFLIINSFIMSLYFRIFSCRYLFDFIYTIFIYSFFVGYFTSKEGVFILLHTHTTAENSVFR
jgi:hypothetical protein